MKIIIEDKKTSISHIGDWVVKIDKNTGDYKSANKVREWVRLFAARFTYPLCATLMMELWMVLYDQVIFMLAMYVTPQWIWKKQAICAHMMKLDGQALWKPR